MTTDGFLAATGAASSAAAAGPVRAPAARDGGSAAPTLALTRENDALRRQLGAARDRLVEAAIDAGRLHARIEALRAELAEVRAGRDAWRSEAERLVGWSAQRAVGGIG